jgi:glycosyltransferase involved in cell wall biosynthesis
LKTKLNLCVVGILCDQKNQLDALKALDVLVNLKKLDNIHLHFIGDKREDYFALLTNFISDKKLWAFVTLHGHCNNIKEQLQFMNLGIVCARDEGFGRVTIEFMFNRMPVIASNSGANPELVKDGVFGEIYPIENSWILADKIEKYVRKPEILEITGKKVQEYALQNFSSKRNSDLIYSKIQAILNQ